MWDTSAVQQNQVLTNYTHGTIIRGAGGTISYQETEPQQKSQGPTYQGPNNFSFQNSVEVTSWEVTTSLNAECFDLTSWPVCG